MTHSSGGSVLATAEDGGGGRSARRASSTCSGSRRFRSASVAVQGGPGTLNPSSAGGHGPSWRMVVELGDSVRAWGTYPGGQSGNPVSPHYKDRLPLWRAGELDTLFAPRDTLSLVPTARVAPHSCQAQVHERRASRGGCDRAGHGARRANADARHRWCSDRLPATSCARRETPPRRCARVGRTACRRSRSWGCDRIVER